MKLYLAFYLSVNCVLASYYGPKSDLLGKRQEAKIKSICETHEYLDSAGNWRIAWQEYLLYNDKREIILDNAYNQDDNLTDSVRFKYDKRENLVELSSYCLRDSFQLRRSVYNYDDSGKLSNIKTYRINGTLQKIERFNKFGRFDTEPFDSLGNPDKHIIRKYDSSNSLYEVDIKTSQGYVEAKEYHKYLRNGLVERTKYVTVFAGLMTRSVIRYNKYGSVLSELDFSRKLIPYIKWVRHYNELGDEVLSRYTEFENNRFKTDTEVKHYEYDFNGFWTEIRFIDRGSLHERIRRKIEYY